MNGRPSPRPRHISFRFLGWLAVVAMVALSVVSPVTLAAKGNNGTIKIHEQGTPAGTESNDPKVCVFNVEGFNFDSGQRGYLQFDPQGGDGPHGTAAGPFSWGPANGTGRYDTEYYRLKPGHYKATLYGKKGSTGALSDVKAKSKVFKVRCETPHQTPTPTPAAATPTPTPPAATPTPTPGGGEEGATPTPTPPTATPTPTPRGGEEGATPTPTPQGGVSGATATPKVTLPPTDTAAALAAQPSSDGWRIVLLGLAAILATVLLLTPVRSSIRR